MSPASIIGQEGSINFNVIRAYPIKCLWDFIELEEVLRDVDMISKGSKNNCWESELEWQRETKNVTF